MENDFISRSKLLETLRKEKIPYDADINYFITTAPAADVRPVLQCKDCRHYKPFPIEGTEGVCKFRGYGGNYPCCYDDFCSKAERKASKVKPRRITRFEILKSAPRLCIP